MTTHKKECCCQSQPVSKPHSKCPVNDKKGQSVATETLKHLVKTSLQSEIKNAQYYFCKAADCDTVYFDPQTGQCFEKSALNIRVGLKETQDPIWVCYCFNISQKMIEDEIKDTGSSASGDRIRREVEAKNCSCEILNPSGRCCLGEVLIAEKQAEKKFNPIVSKEAQS